MHKSAIYYSTKLSNSNKILLFIFALTITIVANSAVVHIGSFSVINNAKRLQLRVKSIGYPAIIKKIRINGRLLSNVFIKDLSNSAARNTCNRLKRNNIRCYVNFDSSNNLPNNSPSSSDYRPNTKYLSNRNTSSAKKTVPSTNEYRRSTPSYGNSTNSRYIGNSKTNRQAPFIPGKSEFNL